MPRPPASRILFILLLGAAALIAACSPSAVATAPPATAPATAPIASAPAGAAQALPAEVSVAEAGALRDAGAFMLDVRQPDEWATGHIAGATLIPLGDLSARLAEVPKDARVVVVCHSGNRSAQGRDILLGAGYPSVTSMAGGMSAWVAAGNPTTTGG